MPGPVIIRAVLMALAVPRTRLRPSVPRSAPGQIPWPGGCERQWRDTDLQRLGGPSRAAAAVMTGRGRMSGRVIARPEMTEDTRLAEAREQFLTGELIGPGRARDTILASWWRSREWNVAADRIDLSYVRDPDLDTPLTRSALPVLRDLRDNLEGQPVSVVLTDARGVLLSRLTADHDLERHLDHVQLLPGFSYAEQFVGTNGIGAALESGQAALVLVTSTTPSTWRTSPARRRRSDTQDRKRVTPTIYPRSPTRPTPAGRLDERCAVAGVGVEQSSPWWCAAGR
jgi:hypothetical protein